MNTGLRQHCVLIKNIETLLDRPNKMNKNSITVIDVHIGSTLKINTSTIYVVTLSNQRLFVLRKNIFLL